MWLHFLLLQLCKGLAKGQRPAIRTTTYTLRSSPAVSSADQCGGGVLVGVWPHTTTALGTYRYYRLFCTRTLRWLIHSTRFILFITNWDRNFIFTRAIYNLVTRLSHKMLRSDCNIRSICFYNEVLCLTAVYFVL